MFNLIHLLMELVIGTAAGWIAATLMKLDNSNMVFNCFLGLVGAIAGGIIGGLIQIGPSGVIGKIIFSVIGACAVIWIYRKFIKS
ncbi:MAG TPA: GlsB/YeaQ/YmgE family stress response membrane protein [Erysipelotrichaceae bacterium]|nr:GlsB/YeaQ/YmgE family stress response membrane protein [Erysipelotrichaceae bacterium]